jgi:hypothetical protein
VLVKVGSDDDFFNFCDRDRAFAGVIGRDINKAKSSIFSWDRKKRPLAGAFGLLA